MRLPNIAAFPKRSRSWGAKQEPAPVAAAVPVAAGTSSYEGAGFETTRMETAPSAAGHLSNGRKGAQSASAPRTLDQDAALGTRNDAILDASLRAAAEELIQALEDARQEADWHRKALQHAEQRAETLSNRLRPIAKSLGLQQPELRSAEFEPAPAAKPVQSTTQPHREEIVVRANSSVQPPIEDKISAPVPLQEQTPAIQPQASASPLAPAATPRPIPPTSPITTPQPTPQTVAQTAETMQIYCLGAFRLRFLQQWVEEWPSLRALAIFKYLAAHSRTSVSRDVLMDAFWPEADAESARRNLHQAIYSLRQTLRPRADGPQPIVFENGCYRLNSDIDIWIDAQDFEERVETGRRLLAEGSELEAALAFNFAAEAYTGDFLGEAVGEAWAEPSRIRLRNLFCETADWLGRYFYKHGEWTSAIAICRRVLESDSCQESAHLLLMQCFAKQGQRSSAIRQYHALRSLLREELGISPSAETQAFFTRLLQEDRDGVKSPDAGKFTGALNPV